MIHVTACVISKNEEDRIKRCLESLSFCDEILVLDSGSTDKTREIAESCGARVELQDFLGHSKQKFRAAELASHDWVLSLDCDEYVTSELREEIRINLGSDLSKTIGFRVPRRNIYLGKAMRHGIFWPDRKLRLFDRRACQWGDTDPHDKVEPHAQGEVLSLKGEIVHDSYRSFAEHKHTVLNFAQIAAKAMAREGRKASFLSPWLRGLGAMLKSLVLKHGFLDGWRGVLAAWMSGRYDWIKYRELRRIRAEARA